MTLARKNTSTITIGVFALLLLVGATMLFTYAQRLQLQNAIYEALATARTDLAQNSINEKQQLVTREYSDIVLDCELRGEYDAVINLDSREMTARELRRALELHKECGQYFYSRNALALVLFESEIKRLQELSKLLEDTRAKNIVFPLAQQWEQILELEKEYNKIFGDNITIQQRYWEVDLKRRLGEIDFTKREEEIGILNGIARLNNTRLTEMQSERGELHLSEGKHWEEFVEGYLSAN